MNTDRHPHRSPSGLLTRAAWERDVEAAHGRMPRWWRSAEERDRQFLAWVESEALGLMAQLGRLETDRSPGLGTALSGIRRALAEDAGWARDAAEAHDPERHRADGQGTAHPRRDAA
jgi:hypothetical protein